VTAVGTAEGCDLLILLSKIKRSQPSAAPTGIEGASAKKPSFRLSGTAVFLRARFALARVGFMAR
jgi:hypothetical protein